MYVCTCRSKEFLFANKNFLNSSLLLKNGNIQNQNLPQILVFFAVGGIRINHCDKTPFNGVCFVPVWKNLAVDLFLSRIERWRDIWNGSSSLWKCEHVSGRMPIHYEY